MFEDLEVPEGGFACICADPPWGFRNWKDVEGNRSVENHYVTMTNKDILAMPVADISAKDAHLFLWATGPQLPLAFQVIDAWGFKYSGMGFVWIKQRRGFNPQQITMLAGVESDLHVGLGYTTRKNAEFVLLARRGKARRIAADVREVILSPARQHSRKPDEAYARMRRYCSGPHVELFARESREGWATWGNENSKFDGVATA